MERGSDEKIFSLSRKYNTDAFLEMKHWENIRKMIGGGMKIFLFYEVLQGGGGVEISRFSYYVIQGAFVSKNFMCLISQHYSKHFCICFFFFVLIFFELKKSSTSVLSCLVDNKNYWFLKNFRFRNIQNRFTAVVSILTKPANIRFDVI